MPNGVGRDLAFYSKFNKDLLEFLRRRPDVDLESLDHATEEKPYPLDKARNNKLIHDRSGDRIFVMSATGYAYIRFNSINKPKYLIRAGGYISYPFKKIFLTNEAQPGKQISIIIGYEAFIEFASPYSTIKMLNAIGIEVNPATEDKQDSLISQVLKKGDVQPTDFTQKNAVMVASIPTLILTQNEARKRFYLVHLGSSVVYLGNNLVTLGKGIPFYPQDIMGEENLPVTASLYGIALPGGAFVEIDYMEYASDILARAAYASSDPGSLQEIDYMEYANDELAQTTYVSSQVYGSDITSSGTPSTDVEPEGGTPANAIDDILDDAHKIQWPSASLPVALIVEYIAERTIAKYTVAGAKVADNDRSPKDWTFDGWNGSSWDTLDTVTGETAWGDFEVRTFYVDTPAPYIKYRLCISDENGAVSTVLTEIEMMEINLQCYSEDTIKEQELYALKVIAIITASLDETLTKTLDPTLNLSGEKTIKFSIRASRTGSHIKIGLHDSGGETTEITPNIAQANIWQTVEWDISGVADADKNVIDQIIITILNADAENVFYLDWLRTIARLQCFSEDNTKVQGLYSLKVVAAQTLSLGDTLTKTVSPTLDLSGETTVKFSIRASRTGSNIKIGLHDAGGVTTEITPNITQANVWKSIEWDISAVADGDKDVIEQIIVTVLNADAENVFYLDNLRAPVETPQEIRVLEET